MPEILGDTGVYFDPESVDEIESALLLLIQDRDAREKLAACAFRRARDYSWRRSADATFRFLAEIASREKNQKSRAIWNGR